LDPRYPACHENKKGEASDLAVKFYLRKLILSGGFRDHIHAAAAFVEFDFAIHEREQSPIAAGADILARDKFAAALTHDDAARADNLAAKFFYAETLADAVASVAYTSLTFLMCHKIKL
jgi:hypothetical protein